MNTYHAQKGFSMALALGVAAIIVVVAGIAVFTATRKSASPGNDAMEKKEMFVSSPAASQGQVTPDAMEKKTPATGDTMVKYTGAVLAGTSAPLLDFTQADYQAAVASDKLIVLYFYANWCPICRQEFPQMQAAFNELSTDQVVGFRVNFNDNETDANEQALAREHGIAYQHTKVFVRNGERVLKSPETWSKDEYLSEIQSALAQ